jgi:hypothetical protein
MNCRRATYSVRATENAHADCYDPLSLKLASGAI